MRDTFNEINITPLTDIFLVLLIIMMVVAPLLDQQGLNLTVPDLVKQEHLTKNNSSKVMTIFVSADNKYYYNGEEVQAENLGDLISKEAKDLKDGLMIQAQSDSSHGAVVKLMDIARNSGVTAISLTEG